MNLDKLLEKFKDTLKKVCSSFSSGFSKIKNKIVQAFSKKETDENKSFIYRHKFKIITAVLLVAAVALGLTLVTYKKEEQKKYTITDNKAEDYFYDGQYDKAVAEYEKLLKGEKPNKLWLMKISEVYSVKGDLVNSKKYIDKAKKTGSKEPELLNYIAFTEFMNNDLKAALEDGGKAIKLYPKNKSIVKTMFTIYMANNKINDAKLLMVTYPVDSKSAYDNAEYARMLILSGDWDKGLEKLKLAWEKNKDEYKIYDVLSQIAVYNKDTLLEKVTNLSNSVKTEPAYKMWLAKIYSASSDTSDMADKIMKEIEKEKIGNIEYKLIDASILQNSKDTNKNKEGDKLIEDIIKKYPNDYRVLHTAGWYYLNKKDLEKAEKYCRASIVKNKGYADNYGFLMPEILKAKGKSTEGEPFFRTAMYKEPYNYNITISVANYYWYTTKNTAKAMDYFKLAELIKPEDPEIKYNMAQIDISNNKLDDAVPILKQCIKLADSVPKYHRTLGTIYLKKGKNSDAITEIRYAFHADEEDVMTLNNAGAYYFLIEGSVDRGMVNFQTAYEGLKNGNYDKYTKDTITSNYNKAKAVYDKFKNGNGDSITLPEFTFFY